MENILKESLIFTHGGPLAGLYGMLATQKLSSTGALLEHGDTFIKFTDPNNEYTEENNLLFFESIMDRNNLSYSSMLENLEDRGGFSFLLVASSKSLLNQVDMVGNSDGIILGRSDNSPLEIELSKLDYKILVPSFYEETIKNFCQQLKAGGHTTIEDSIVYKPIEEIKELLSNHSENKFERQKKLCQSIELNAEFSDKFFSLPPQTVKTKSGQISAFTSEALPIKPIEKKNFNNAEDLVSHMRERPTPGNLQRNSRLLFLESFNNSLSSHIVKISNQKPLILDLFNNPEDLSFCLNNLAKLYPSKEIVENGENRISAYALRGPISKLRKDTENPQRVNAIIECLKIAQQRDISPQECYDIISKYVDIKQDIRNGCTNEEAYSKEWFIAIDRVPQPVMSLKDAKNLVENNSEKDLLVWKAGMTQWAEIKTIPQFNAELNLDKTKTLAVGNIANFKAKYSESTLTSDRKLKIG